MCNFKCEIRKVREKGGGGRLNNAHQIWFIFLYFFQYCFSFLSLSLPLFCQSLWVLLFLSYNYQTFTITTPTPNTQYESKPTRFYIHSFPHRHCLRLSSSSSLSPSLRRISGRSSLLTLLGILQFFLFFVNFSLIMLSFSFIAFRCPEFQYFPAGLLCSQPFNLFNSLLFHDLV